MTLNSFRRTLPICSALSLLIALVPVSLQAHKVSAVSVVTDLDTKEQKWKVEFAMDVDPTGDPAIDDLITPEQAGETFATESLQIYFDDTTIDAGKPELQVISDSDENTPADLRRQKVVATMKGDIPKDSENFLLYVDENTEAAVVMVVIKDGKPARRLQVLYPGEFSNPENVETVIEGDPFTAEAAENPPVDTANDRDSTESSGQKSPGAGRWLIAAIAAGILLAALVVFRKKSRQKE